MKINDKVWFYNIDIKGTIKTGIINEIIQESCYHNKFITKYKLDSGKELTPNYAVFDDENNAIEAYNNRIDYLVSVERDNVKKHEDKIKDLLRKKINTKL